MIKKIQVTKLEAARRQIEVAIVMFLGYGDTVSIHTLIAAAHNILRNLSDKVGMKDYIVKNQDLVNESFRKRYFEKINEAENFFKHADNDSNKVLEFQPELTTFFIFDAIRMYYKLTSEYPSVMGKFIAWFYVNNPDSVSSDFKHLIDSALKLGVNPEDRKFFLDLRT